MDRHQPDDVARFGVRGRQRLVGLAGDELRELRDEVGEGEGRRTVEASGLVDELSQVGQLAFAQELRHEDGVVARAGEGFLDELCDGDPVLDGAEVAEDGSGEFDAAPLR